MRQSSVLVCICLALAGCVPQPDAPATPTDRDDACGARQLQYLVGKDVAALSPMTFAQTVRVIRPGQGITKDYRPDRLNFNLDEAGKISRIHCM